MYFITPLCLVCLKSKANLRLLNKEMLEKLMYCTEKVKEDIPYFDRLKICRNCLDKLNVAYHFKKMCLSSISQFKDYIEQLEQASKKFCGLRVKLIDIKRKDEAGDLYIKQYLDGQVDVKTEIILDETLSQSFGCNEFEAHLDKEQKPLSRGVEIVEDFRNENQMKSDEPGIFNIKQQADEQFTTVFVKKENVDEINFHDDGNNESQKRYSNEELTRALHKEEMLEDTCQESLKSQLKSDLNSKEQSFSCPNCRKHFINEVALKAHMSTHTDTTKHSCTICGYSFKWRSYLKQHMSTHSDQRPHTCTICGNSFKLKVTLNRHVLTHSGERPFSCTMCESSFLRKNSLKQHMASHSEQRPFSCSICGNRFQLNIYLKQHMLIHANQRSHSCTTCGKSFMMKTHLNRHMLVHSDERPHSCTICGSSFQRKYYLRQHMLTHSDQRPYSCSTCGSSFQLKIYLNRHMLTHSNRRPHTCTMCGRTFIRKSSLNQHVLNHNFPCAICGSSFKKKVHLTRHLLTHSDEPAVI